MRIDLLEQNAKKIYSVLEEMSKKKYSEDTLFSEYKKLSIIRKSPAYIAQIRKFLINNSFVVNDAIKMKFTEKDILEILKKQSEYTMLNRKDKPLSTKKRKPRKIYTHKVIDGVLQPEQKSNLIPKEKFLDSMTTLEIINYLLKNRKILIKDDIIYTPVL